MKDHNIPCGQMSDSWLNDHEDRNYVERRVKEAFDASHKNKAFGASTFMCLQNSAFRKIAEEYADAPEELRQRMSEFRFSAEFIMHYDSAVEAWNRENYRYTQEQELLQEEMEQAHDDMRILRSMMSEEEFSALMQRVEDYRDAEYEYFHSEEE